MKHILPKTELANTASHAVGLLFGLISLVVLVLKIDFIPIGVYVYLGCFLFMFSASTIYHFVTRNHLKNRWQTVDHISIYFLIAGTVTPFILAYLDSDKSHFILQILWGFVAFGSIFKIFFAGRFKIVSTIIYLSMGWGAVFIMKDVISSMPFNILFWLGIGGVFYSLGTIFYLWKKLTYHHAIWHLFVLGGAISHWYSIWLSLKLIA